MCDGGGGQGYDGDMALLVKAGRLFACGWLALRLLRCTHVTSCHKLSHASMLLLVGLLEHQSM
jgi:hypothetical protein